MPPLVTAQKMRITPGCGMPARVLYKGAVRPQVHAHGRAAHRAVRHQFAGYPHILLPGHHLPDNCFVVVSSLTAGPGTLPQAIVALRVEQAAFIKPGFLKAVVYIGCKHKIILVLHQLQKVMVNRLWGIQIAVDIDIPAPVRPVFFQAAKGIKAAGIHITKAVFLNKIPEMLLEAFAGVGEPGGGGKPRTGSNHHCVRRLKFLPEPPDITAAGSCRFHSRYS